MATSVSQYKGQPVYRMTFDMVSRNGNPRATFRGRPALPYGKSSRTLGLLEGETWDVLVTGYISHRRFYTLKLLRKIEE